MNGKILSTYKEKNKPEYEKCDRIEITFEETPIFSPSLKK